MSLLHPEHLSWTALLGRWVQLAQAALALPRDAEGERWRQSVPSIIALQAVTFALAELDRVAPPERAVALDKAETLIRLHRKALEEFWRGAIAPQLLRGLCDDAQQAARRARLSLEFDARPDVSD